MKTATPTATTTTVKKDLKQAEELMKRYALLNRSRKDLLDTIMEELKGYEDEMAKTQKALIEIGERNKPAFNADGNLEFDEGYLHIAHNTVVNTKKKFDLAEFAEMKPDMVDIKLKVAPIKKAFLDKDQRKELTSLGVEVDTAEKVEVKLRKGAGE